MEATATNVRLVSITIEHFRSFEYEYLVRFNSNMTAVVGPNWAGKSNILKALMFGFGRSAEEMFVDDIRSLINDNYLRLCEASGDDASCSVTITIAVGGREVNLKRTLYEDRRELYEIDGEACGRTEFRNNALEFGLHVDQCGLVLRQGSITSLIGKTPLELSAFIEKMCGSDLLAADVKEADGQLRQTLNALINGKSELRNLRLTRRRHKNDADTQLLRMRLDEEERMLALAKLWRTDKRIRVCQSDIRKLPDDTGEMAKLEGLARERLAIQEQLQEHAEAIRNEKSALLSAQDELQRFILEKQEFASRHLDADLQLKDLYSRRAKIETAISEARTKEQEALGKFPTAQEKVELAQKSTESVEVDPDVLIELWNLEDTFQQNNQGLFKQVESLEAIRQAFTTSYEDLSMAERSRDMRAQLMRGELEILKRRRGIYEKKLASISCDLEPTRARLEELAAVVDEALSGYPSQIETIRRLIAERDFVKGKAKRKRQLRHSVRIVDGLRAAFGSRVVGVLGDLVMPCKPAYATAVRRVLRGHLFAIVVDSRATMTECVSYLKRSNQPAMQILVLPSEPPKRKTIPRNLLGRAAMFESICLVTPALPLHLQDRVLYLIRSLFDDVVFCDDVNLLPQLAFTRVDRFSVVSSDGSILSKNGVFETAKKTKSTRQTDQAAAEIEVTKRLAEAIVHLRKSETAVGYLRELNGLQHIYDSMKNDHQDMQTRLEMLNQEIDGSEAYLQVVEQQIQDVRKELQASAKRDKTKLQQLEGLEKSIRSKRPGLFQDVSARCGIPTESLVKIVDPHGLNKDLSALTEATEELESIQLAIKKSQEEISRLAADMEKINHEANPVVEEESRARADAERARSQLSATQTAVERSCAELRRLKIQEGIYRKQLTYVTGSATSAKKEYALHRKAANDLRGELARLRTERAAILGEYVQKLPPDQREDLAGATFDERVAMQVDYATLSREVRNLTAIEKFCRDAEHAVSRLNVLLLERHIGVNDPQCLTRLENRCRAAAERLKNLTIKAANEQRSLKRVVERRAEIFTTFLQKLQQKVTKTYSELTFGGAMSIILGGGLSDPSRTFDGGVLLDCRPKGEKFTEFANLSWGQRNQASLALLLAIHACLPLPFLAIDEADAPLSSKHCRILSQYLHNQGQQVVMVSHRSGTLNIPAARAVGYSVIGVTKIPAPRPGEDDTRIYHVSFDPPLDGQAAPKAPPIDGDHLSEGQQAELEGAASIDEAAEIQSLPIETT